MSLTDKLKAASEKAALREFEVTITETLKMKVTVEAKDRLEAEQIVSDKWRDSEYILDADDFIDVEFEAAAVKLERAGKGKEGIEL